MGLRKFWNYLSVSNKLYTVIGLMAFLIAIELATLYFAMDTLSAVRTFVAGESSWSKAQKDAVISLHKYARTHDITEYENFKNRLLIPLGDSRARQALLESDPINIDDATSGFLQGRVHPDDIPGVVRLIRRFHSIPKFKKAIDIWVIGDRMTLELLEKGDHLHTQIQQKASLSEIDEILNQIDAQNDELTLLEENFSRVLGEGSRWLEHILIFILFFAVLTVEVTGLFLAFGISRNLSKGLHEINEAAHKVGQGHFDIRVPVRTEDELGALARSLNKMASELKTNTFQKHQAETANKVKSLFLANISHEIRTPLNAILGFAELLKDKNISEEERAQYVNIISRTGETLRSLISEILDLSKLEAGHLDIEKTDFSLDQLLEEVSAVVSAKIKDKKLNLEFHNLSDIPLQLHTDAARLRQILINLIGNAIKFTEEGFVKVSSRFSEGLLTITISDSGNGIPLELQDRLFKPFSQIDGSLTRKYDGTGLGLALSKKLAQLLGGDVELVESAVSKGSTFKVSLPVEVPTGLIPPAPPTGHIRHRLENFSVLLIDDVEDNRLLVSRVLSRQGASVDLASNGAEGVAKALQHPYDVVLMDIQMPVMDGYTATRILREAGYTQPIIALTAHALKDDRELCLNAGCTDYMTKPVKIDQLINILAKDRSFPLK